MRITRRLGANKQQQPTLSSLRTVHFGFDLYLEQLEVDVTQLSLVFFTSPSTLWLMMIQYLAFLVILCARTQ